MIHPLTNLLSWNNQLEVHIECKLLMRIVNPVVRDHLIGDEQVFGFAGRIRRLRYICAAN